MRDWFGMGEAGRAFGAREMVTFGETHQHAQDVEDALYVGLTLDSGFAFFADVVTLEDLRAELGRRLGGRALQRALAALPERL